MLQDFDVISWYGLFVPASTQAAIVAKLNRNLGDALASTDIKKRFAKMDADPAVMKPDEFAQFVRREIDTWGKVIKAAGIK